VHGDGQLGNIGSDNRRLARDLDKLRSLPDLEFHVDVRDGAGVRSHPVVVESLEARSLNRQLVSADWNLLHGIVTAGIGRGGDVQVGCGVHNRNLGVRDGGTGWIGHGTDELAILNLREGAEAQSQHGKHCEAKLQSFHSLPPRICGAWIVGACTENPFKTAANCLSCSAWEPYPNPTFLRDGVLRLACGEWELFHSLL